jgi:hypothetical protein
MGIFHKLSWMTVGPVTSMSGGGLSQSFAQSSDQSDWSSTAPGRMLIMLINGSSARGPHIL